ncbi:TraM recognition domain-containing protein [Euzebya sp.]|uniref:type IV secretory system conjugative DNA transfer family protein n=1 Tax=Euzebya sp. TaxID=1971409 RepID=UPI003511E952
MRTPGHPGQPGVTVALTGLCGLLAVAAVLLAAGHTTSVLTGQPPPTGGLADALTTLTSPTDPGSQLGSPTMSPWVYWSVVAGLLAGLGIAGGAVWRLANSIPSGPPVGTATVADVRRVASRRALLRRAGTLRPSLDRPVAADVGYLLGRARGREVWATVEDSILLLGPPRSGKGLHVVINAVLDAPGAVITTSTRPDTLNVTIAARQAVGPVAVFDPQHLATRHDTGLRWSIVRGCELPHTAMVRAAGLAASTGMGGGVVDGGFWEAKTRIAVQALLHAAALDGRDARTVYQWALNPASAADAVRILHTHPDAADGWADGLDAVITADPRTRDSIWHGVALAVAALADPRVMHAVTPHPDEQFNPATFLRDGGTLYLLATGTGATASAALVAAFLEDLTETARTLAATAPGNRLDPPVLLALDEIGNLAPLPSLPTLMAEGGGTGITTMPVLQSMAQARSRWGDHAATAIWDAAIVKIILGGGSNSRDLTDLSSLLGDRDEITSSTTTDANGHRSHQRSVRRVPVMAPDAIRTLPFGTGLVLFRTAPPIITTLRPWTTRTDPTRRRGAVEPRRGPRRRQRTRRTGRRRATRK